MNLTENFELDEFVVSREYPELIKEPKTKQVECLKLLCESILQPVRDFSGKTIVTSGYRSKMLNDAVNGSKDSDHLYGAAADIITDRVLETYHWILQQGLPFKHLIYYGNYIHISVNIPGRKYDHKEFKDV